MKRQLVLGMAVMVGIGVAGGLVMGEGRGADTRAAATGPATTAAAGKVTFFGVETEGVGRVVYVVDHSGSMLDSFGFCRRGLLNSITGLGPAQRFAVVAFSETVVGYPINGKWSAAGQQAAQDFETWILEVKAQGENDDVLDPFASAFKRAMAMQPLPEVVYFMTDGNFAPRLVGEVAKLNAGKKVIIHTIALVKITREAEENLKKIAKENGGTFKVVAEKDLKDVERLGQ